MDSKKVAYLMYLVGFLDLFGVSLVVPLLGKHARELGASPSVAGALGSIYGGLQLFSSPLAGRWSDLSSRRLVLFWCLLLSAFGYFLLSLSTSLIILLLSRIPTGLFKHSQELAKAHLSDVTPVSQRSQCLGVFGSVSSVGFILGPIVGGHISSMPRGFELTSYLTMSLFLLNSGPIVGGHIAELRGGFYIIASITTLSLLLNAVIVWWFVPEVTRNKVTEENSASSKDTHREKSNKNRSLNPLAALSVFWSVNWSKLWDLFLVRFLLGFAVLVSRSNFALTLDYKYQASATVTGYVISYGALVSTASGFFVGKISKYYSSDSRLLFHMGCVQVATLLAISFAPSLWVLVLCTTPLSISTAISRVCATNLTIERGSPEETGALLGLGASMLSIARMLSPLIGGVAQELHLSGPTLVGSFCAGIGSLLLVILPFKAPPKIKLN